MCTIRQLITLLSIVIAIAVTGCDSGPAEFAVTGEVTFNGEPLKEGLILFEPTDGTGDSHDASIKDGKYSANVTAGDKLVRITANEVVGQKKAYDTPDSPMVDITKEIIPPKFNRQSKLTATIASDASKHDFNLVDK